MTALDIDIIDDDEPTPLVKKPTPSSSARSFKFHRNYKWLVPLFLGIFAATAFFFLSEFEAVEAGFLAKEDVTVKYTSSDGESGIVSTSSTGKKQKKPGLLSKVFGTPSPTPQPSLAPTNPPTVAPTTEPQNPLLNLPKMLLAFQEKRQEWYDQLEKDYGKENFENMFLDHVRTAIIPPNEESIIRPANETVPLYSNNRMRRKMMIKILEAQEAAQHQRSRNLRPTDSSSAESGAQQTRRQAGFTNTHKFPKFVLATGGHSAAAGHGNMWRESYTKVVERGVQDIFAACGIDFVSRNHAMGGTASAPEIAICSKEIFGTDIDVLLWDAGMLDQKAHWKMLMYFLRAGTLAQQPAVLGFRLDQGRNSGRTKTVQAAEDTGMPAFVLDHEESRKMNGQIPNTMGLSDAEIAEMPPFVRNFRCTYQIENGDPGCNAEKWNMTMCPNRPFKTSWHPGWRAHALNGNLLGMWLTNVMEDALKELAAERPDPALLDQLRAFEVADRKEFMSRELPMSILKDLQLPSDVDPEMFYRGSNICHTARLPAETRHLGLLTESSLVGEDSYDKGIELETAKNNTPEDKSMQLAYEQGARNTCPIPLNKDYKDFFYVAYSHGWSQLTLPNDAEVKAYGSASEPLRGVVAVCFAGGASQKENIDSPYLFGAAVAEMEVNGVKVTTLTAFQGCYFLKHTGGHVWKPNSDGRFQIRAKVKWATYFIRFSSIVIW